MRIAMMLLVLLAGALCACVPLEDDNPQHESAGSESNQPVERDQPDPVRRAQTTDQQEDESAQSQVWQVERDPLEGAREMTVDADDDYGEVLYGAEHTVYVVQAGDTAHNIARAHDMTLAELLEINDDLEDPNVLRIGQELRVQQEEGVRIDSDDASTAGLMTPDGQGERIARTQFAPQPVGVTFGDGTHRVGMDIPPGRYRSTNPTSACLWERLNALTDDLSNIIGQELANGGSAVADVLPTDAGFKTWDCGTWSSDLAPITNSPKAGFGDGFWLVGIDLAPGVWTATVPGNSEFCGWRRLASFLGDFDADVIADGIVQSGDVMVTILETDVGFDSFGCGRWTFVAE